MQETGSEGRSGRDARGYIVYSERARERANERTDGPTERAKWVVERYSTSELRDALLSGVQHTLLYSIVAGGWEGGSEGLH